MYWGWAPDYTWKRGVEEGFHIFGSSSGGPLSLLQPWCRLSMWTLEGKEWEGFCNYNWKWLVNFPGGLHFFQHISREKGWRLNGWEHRCLSPLGHIMCAKHQTEEFLIPTWDTPTRGSHTLNFSISLGLAKLAPTQSWHPQEIRRPNSKGWF